SSPINDRIFFLLAACFIVDGDAAAPGHGNIITFLIFHGVQVDILNIASILCLEYGLLNDFARRATNMKRPHGELRARLADGLGCDNADSLTDINKFPSAQIPAVAHLAYTSQGL